MNGPHEAVCSRTRLGTDPKPDRSLQGGRLGAGGMGVVYLAIDSADRKVAIKVIRPELASDRAFRARFEREVEAAERVQGAYTARGASR